MRVVLLRVVNAALIAALALMLPACGENPEPLTVAEDTSGNFSYPLGVASDGTNIYVSDSGNHTIRTVDPIAASIATLAGAAEYPGLLDGTGAVARFTQPRYLIESGGTLYIAGGPDRTIRKTVTGTGAVTTLAGLLGTAGTAASGTADTDGTNARFTEPTGIALLGTDLYILDWGAGAPFLRRVATATGVTTELQFAPATLEGKPIADYLAGSYGMATDGTFLYVTNTDASTVLKGVIDNTPVPPALPIVTFEVFAGASGQAGSTDGAALMARFFDPTGIACDGAALYVADTGNSTIRKIDLTLNTVSTLAGSAGLTGIADGTGSAARFNYPFGIAVNGANLYVADTHNHTIRKVVLADGAVTTIAGKPGIRGSNDVP